MNPQIEQVEPGVYSVLVDGRSYEARVEQAEGGVAVFIDGHRFEIEVRDPRRWSRQTGARDRGPLNVVAPMPGKIVRLLVAAGDTVAAARAAGGGSHEDAERSESAQSRAGGFADRRGRRYGGRGGCAGDYPRCFARNGSPCTP
jgi:hypothetical protein